LYPLSINSRVVTVVFLLSAILSGGCAAQRTAPVISAPSAWRPPLTVGVAEQRRAPAMAVSADQVTFAWVGASESGVHQDIVAIRGGQITPAVTLPLPPTFPRDSQLIPAGGEYNYHLIWLDVDGQGTAQVYTAVIDRTLGVFRGVLPVSERGARCFDTFANPDNSLWVVWQSHTDDTLHTAYIDPSGRVLRTQALGAAQGCPSTASTSEARYLAWPQQGQIYIAAFSGSGNMQPPQAVVASPSLGDADRLRGVSVAGSADRLYVFWNITRANNVDESWFASGTLLGTWEPPQRLVLSSDEATPYATTYNTGPAYAAQQRWEGQQVAWADPLRIASDVLPVAAEIDGNKIGVLYFEAGRVAGYQPVAPTGSLLGTPRLASDRDRFLYLIWSDPQETGAAHFNVSATKTLLED